MAAQIKRPAWQLAAAVGIALCAAAVLFCSTALRGEARRLFLPQLQRGQILPYEVHGHVERKVKTERKVSSMRGPQDYQGDLSGLVRLSVQEVRAAKSEPWVSAQVELLPA